LRRSTIEEWATMPEDLRFHAGMGLQAALEKFAFTLSLLQTPEAVARVAKEICEDAAADSVTTLEIRFAPQLHVGAPPFSIEAIVDAAADSGARLILCALHGEPASLVEKLVDVAISRNSVVGIDLAGAPGSEFSFAEYGAAFTRARDAGLGRTVHAGEGRPPSEIRAAIEILHAQRIGHGTTLLDDPRVCDLVIRRGIVIEACLSSNVHTGAIAQASQHPLPRWLALGVNACINTDNTLLSDCTSTSEHQLAAQLPGMTPELLVRAVENGHRGAFRR
jgi:adenosine deaminase